MVSDHLIQDSVKPSQSSNDEEVLVKVDQVSKKFCRTLKKSLWYGIQDISSELIGRKYEHELRPDEFWSVKDVSFELRRGECLGIMGPNGAGKSTLLKMLNGLIKPDQGRIEIKGRVGALIELGTGFNPILTGRENIYNNAAVLGFSRAEVREKLDAIVDFSEVGEFLDMPVKNYSSGMKVRLGFAVAAQMEPDVLIVDEVLAVGDVGFRLKCFNRIFELAKKCSIILVSHSIPQMSRVATNIMMLDKGEAILNTDNPTIGIEKYFDLFETEGEANYESEAIDLLVAHVVNLGNPDEIHPKVIYLSELQIKIKYIFKKEVERYTINLAIRDKEQRLVAQSFLELDNYNQAKDGESFEVNIQFPQSFFSTGFYSIDVIFREIDTNNNQPKGYLANFRNVMKFRASNPDGFSNAGIKLPCDYKIIKSAVA